MTASGHQFNPVSANETDVREELLAPILRILEYKRGSKWDLVTEFPLAYDRITLGRWKKGSPAIRGKADYLLKAGPRARWVLEAKAPGKIFAQDVDQLLSYARHPEVAATYACICDGLEFRVYRSNQFADEEPVASFKVSSVAEAVGKLGGLLHPLCLSRNAHIGAISLERPIAKGRSGYEKITGGFARVLSVDWGSSLELDQNERFEANELCGRLVGLESALAGGFIERDALGTISVQFDWHYPHILMEQFAQKKGIETTAMHCLSDEISDDPENPTFFETVQTVGVEVGEVGFDLTKWQETVFSVPVRANLVSQTMGYLQDGKVFVGFTNGLMTFSDPANGAPLLWFRFISSAVFHLSI